MHNGVGFSLFACENDLECANFPTGADHASALIRVIELDRQGNLVLVQLPKQTLENGVTVTVRSDQLVQKRARQEA
jgi:hypothetical protein